MDRTISSVNVSPRLWRETWILGGGPSVASTDLAAIASSGFTILAVNDSIDRISGFLPAERLAVVFSMDANWVRRRRSFLQDYRGEKYIALPLETFPECSNIPGVEYLTWACRSTGLSEDSRALHGCNSGYAAINLAYLHGATTIHLVGYDMDPADKTEFKFWAPMFRSMLPQLQSCGATVLNHNPHSYIDAFPIGVPA